MKTHQSWQCVCSPCVWVDLGAKMLSTSVLGFSAGTNLSKMRYNNGPSSAAVWNPRTRLHAEESQPCCEDTLMLIHIIIIEVSVQPGCVFLWLCTQWGLQKQWEGVFSNSQTPYFHRWAWHYNRRQTAVKRVFGCVSHHRQESLLRVLLHSSRLACSPHRCPVFIYLNGTHIKGWENGRKQNACFVA